MTTPSYKGQNQPTATSGGWMTSLFGGGTPAYTSASKPAAAQTATAPSATAPSATAPSATAPSATAPTATPSLPFFAFAAPAYKLTSVSSESGCDDNASTSIAIVIPPSSDSQQ
jgi:hypothetical protein